MSTDWVCQNAQIERIGYFFCGHYNAGCIRVQIAVADGGHCNFDLSPRHVGKFLTAIDRVREDGEYVEELKGLPFCAWFAQNGHGQIVAVSSILDQRGDDMYELEGAK